MRTTLAMFPGQGSQSIGMAKEVLEQFPSMSRTFEEVEDSTHLKIRKLCHEGPEEELRLTVHQQPCILAVSVAIWRVLKKEAGFSPSFFMGHSLGEYSALVAAERLSLTDAATLVYARGQAMQEAVPPGLGAMAAVLRYEEDKLIALCSKISSELEQVVEVVNFNSPKQRIISGHKEAVESVCATLSGERVQSVMLPVSAPFHSSLMRPAREKMRPLIEQTKFVNSAHPIIANITGELADPYEPSYLVRQIDSPVLWTKCTETALAQQVQTLVEVGPGSVLYGLAKRWIPKECDVKHSADLRETIAFLSESSSARE